ncbi:MAG: endolytic transglycosylase MltG [Fibrobacteres bacterium]|jgi:UPF0755 protein|nr:endolytic transglycosylase MltG [Fibrobacterota bacterium]
MSKRKRISGFLGLLIVATTAVGWYALFRPVASGPVDSWRVRPGEGTRQIARRLVAEGRIPSWAEPVFRTTARFRGLDRKLHPGIFRIHRTLPVWNALDILSGPGESGLKVTFPEGRTCTDFAGLLAHSDIADSTEFARLCQSPDSARKLGIPAASMEGYLFPDTYLFNGSESSMDIARVLHKRFRKVLAESGDTTVSPVWKQYGIHGVATLASIVEREAAVRTEAPQIAGVFWLRLQTGMPLGADPTVRYALNKFTGSLTKSDLAFDSPYNTRLYAGLIPGPIAMAGRDALRASLSPDVSGGWLYFVAKDDGSRAHFFSKDLGQHNRYKDQAARNRRTSGVMAP